MALAQMARAALGDGRPPTVRLRVLRVLPRVRGHQLGWRRTLTFAVATWLSRSAPSTARRATASRSARTATSTRPARASCGSRTCRSGTRSRSCSSPTSSSRSPRRCSRPPRGAPAAPGPGFRHPAAPLARRRLMTLLDVVIDPSRSRARSGSSGGSTSTRSAGSGSGDGGELRGLVRRRRGEPVAVPALPRVVPWCRGPLRPAHPRLAWGSSACSRGSSASTWR